MVRNRADRPTHPNPTRRLAVERLEPRRLLTSIHEAQLFLYLLNEARHDPPAYQAREALPVDMSAILPRPPLAIHDALRASSQAHADEMAAFNYFSHVSAVTGRHPNRNAFDHGYPLPEWWDLDANYIESIAAGNGTAAAALRQLSNSTGHRDHLFGVTDFFANNREAGIGYAHNPAARYRHYWAVHLAHSEPIESFLTGVVFEDRNANGTYDLREGLAGVMITSGDRSTVSNAAGGWSLQVPMESTMTVVAWHADWTHERVTEVAMDRDNLQLDFQYDQMTGTAMSRLAFGEWQAAAPPTGGLPIAGSLESDVLPELALSIDVLAISSAPRGTLDPGGVELVAHPARGDAFVDSATGVVTYISHEGSLGADVLQYVVRDSEGATSQPGTLTFHVQEDATPFRNRLNRLDVNGDGRVNAFDVLLVVAFLHEHGAGPPPGMVPPWLDVADPPNFISPFDALTIVAYLSDPVHGEHGEGEVLAAEPSGGSASEPGSRAESLADRLTAIAWIHGRPSEVRHAPTLPSGERAVPVKLRPDSRLSDHPRPPARTTTGLLRRESILVSAADAWPESGASWWPSSLCVFHSRDGESPNDDVLPRLLQEPSHVAAAELQRLDGTILGMLHGPREPTTRLL
jgi:hypothetical protein